MDRLASIKSFVRTVETGSFSAVARELQTTQPTISKQIAALEDYLDVQLLTRSTRKLKLTEAGQQFYSHCQAILDTVDAAEASVGKRQQPSGLLRINCPVTFGQRVIVPRLKRFLAQYPQIELDLMLSDRIINLVEEGVDLAIRIGNHSDSALISQPIGTTRISTMAAASYLQDYGEPQSPQDLTDHNCIIYTQLAKPNEWHYQSKTNASDSNSSCIIKVNGNLRVDSSVAICQAVLSGLGIALAPTWLCCHDISQGEVKLLFPDYKPNLLPIYAVYRRGRFQPAKIACFVKYLAEEFQHDPWLADEALPPRSQVFPK